MRPPAFLAMLLLLPCCDMTSRAPAQGPAAVDVDDVTLGEITSGRARIIDLSYPLNEHTNFWPGEKYQPFSLETIATLEADGVLSKAMTLPEHIGTHIDAPNHFEAAQPSLDQLTPAQLFGPGVLLDVRPQAEVDPDYGLTVDDLEAWEAEHGPIPDGAIVLLNTGWSRFWSQPERYQGRDARGGLHFPAFTGAAARWLVHERNIRGLGVDTLSIDRGVSQDFEVHHIVNAAGRYGLENVTALDQLPPRGFALFVAPMKITAGTGSPTRLFAILPGE